MDPSIVWKGREGEGWLLEVKCFGCAFLDVFHWGYGGIGYGFWVDGVCIYICIDIIGEVVSLEDDVRLLRVSGGGLGSSGECLMRMGNIWNFKTLLFLFFFFLELCSS